MGAPKTGASFHCTFVYCSSMVYEQNKLFMSLHEISNSITTYWVILGDFNCVENFDERHGQPIRLHEIQPFRDCLEWYGLYDIHYTGCLFTWTNTQAGSRRVLSKIDTIFGNDLWDEAFPSASVTFLLVGLFDHSPMLVTFSVLQRKKKAF